MPEEMKQEIPGTAEQTETPEAAGQQGKGRKEKEQKSVGREILSWVFTLLGAVIVALAIRSLIFEPIRVDGASMNDTLANGEAMFVSKLDYASTWFSFPWQSDEAKENAARITTGFGSPSQFDVVIVRYPGRGDTNFVKRLIGLPGDRVKLEGGYLYVNGEKYDEPYVKDEYRAGGRNDFGPVTVPEGRYFVLGDHRSVSVDSRSKAVGCVAAEQIVGKLTWRIWPLKKFGRIQ